MKKINYSALFIVLICTSLLSCTVSDQTKTDKPNVLVFFIDDLGWNDITVNGSSFHETPNIDALAASGVNFKRSYSANPVCSPTRAALMTGKAPQRVGITQWLSGTMEPLNLSEVTIGEAFQEAGYRTGYVGKWHLGKTDDVQPKHQGFEYTAAVNRAGQPASFFYPFGIGERISNVPDLEDYNEGDYLTDALTDKTIEFIDQGDEPFFVVLSHYAVHTPIQAPEELVEKYQTKRLNLIGETEPEMIEEKHNTLARTQQGDPTYAAMMENLDTNIGRVLSHLEEKGILENTIVLFTSDNGGLAHRKRQITPTSVAPLRSGKAWTYEGGIRIPTIISWPEKIQPATSQARVITMDMYPTLLELAGLPMKPQQHLDGESLIPVLNGSLGSEAEERVLMWTYPHVHGNGHLPSDAILSKDWKMIRFQGEEPTELYNLAEDIGETNNLAERYPEKVQALETQLNTWLEQTQ